MEPKRMAERRDNDDPKFNISSEETLEEQRENPRTESDDARFVCPMTLNEHTLPSATRPATLKLEPSLLMERTLNDDPKLK